MYSFIVFKYVNLILWKELYIFKKNGLIFWGIWGEAELILRIWGAKERYFQGAEVLFSGIWGDNALFSGIKGAQPPWGPQILLM